MATPAIAPSIWNVPYRRNPFFTGRRDILNRLYQALWKERTAALSQPQGISGLGGIGKTQIALEYAYSYRSEYKSVLWVQANSTSSLISEFVAIAHLLGLPEQDQQDQYMVADAVLRWFRKQSGWLLILDNADDLAVVEPFAPKTGHGHILLTTRSHSLGTLAHRIELQKMELETGALLLLRRAGVIPVQASLDVALSESRALAIEVSQILDGLPLALDQAGAYILETSCSLQTYLMLYQTRHQEVLRVRGVFDGAYPASVATTWSLSFEKVNQINPAAAELLDFCTFLYPDAIPEEIISKGSDHLIPRLRPVAADPLALDKTISTLLAYSLISRNALDDTLSIHRLVQTVLKDKMDVETQRILAISTIKAVNQVVPDAAPTDWQQYQRYFFSVLACVTLIKEKAINSDEALRLLHQAGHYLRKSNRLEEALAIFEQLLQINPDHIGALNGKGFTLRMVYRFEEALAAHEQVLLLNSNILDGYVGKGFALRTLNRYEEALAAFEQAIRLAPDDSYSYVGKGFVLYSLQRHQEALTAFEHVIQLTPTDADAYIGKGYVLRILKRYKEALVAFEQAILLGPFNVDAYNGKGIALYHLERYEEAVAAHEQALQLNPVFSNAWQCKGDALMKLGRVEEAQKAYEIARQIGNYEEHIER